MAPVEQIVVEKAPVVAPPIVPPQFASPTPSPQVAPITSPSYSPSHGPGIVDNSQSTGMAVASMVLGIISLVFVLICMWFIAFPCSIIAVILGSMAMRANPAGKGMAIAGLVTGIIALVISGITVLGVIGFAGIMSAGAKAAATAPR